MLFCVQRKGAAHLRDRLTLRLLSKGYGCDRRLANGIYRHDSPCAPEASQTFLDTDEHGFIQINYVLLIRKPGSQEWVFVGQALRLPGNRSGCPTVALNQESGNTGISFSGKEGSSFPNS